MIGTGVEDGEAAIGIGSEREIVASVEAGRIGDEFGSGVMRGAGFFGEMELPECLEIW